MGLQRIFSATTAVVGLFISVDYELCDEFRCRGTDLAGKFFQNSLNVNATVPSSTDWRNGVIWALLYIGGIALWSLHVALLESSLVLTPIKVNCFNNYHDSYLLSSNFLLCFFLSFLAHPRRNVRSTFPGQ